MVDRVNLYELLSTAGKELRARIDRVGAYQHRTAIGDAREDVIKDYLSETLTHRFEVNKGKVFDSSGHLSSEFDIIISERADNFPGMNVAGRRMVSIETVHGLIEIKSLSLNLAG